MANPPRGRPPSTSAPPPQRGQRALTFLGGGVLVLAVAGGAWALFGRSSSKSDAAAIGPKAPAATAPQRPVGPVVPGTTPKALPTSAGPVAATATQPAATSSPKPAPTKAPVATTPAPTKPPAAKPAPATAPPVTAPQQGGTIAKKAYTFKVARGDTLWEITQSALRSTGRSTSNASTAAYVAKLYSANRSVIGSDPDLILVGTTVTWPAGL